MMERRPTISKDKRRRSPPTTAASLLLHEAMAAFRKEMVAEEESDDDADDERLKPKAYGDDYRGPASSPKARITAKFEMESDRPGEIHATVTRESLQSDGSWKGTVKHESLPTVINPFTGKPTTFSTPKLRSEFSNKTPAAPGPAVGKVWRTSPTDSSSSQPRGLSDRDTPSRTAKVPFPVRSDSLHWQNKATRITKSRASPQTAQQQRTSPRRHSPSAPAPPTRKAPSKPTLSPKSPSKRPHRPRPPSSWSTTATISYSPPTSANLDRPDRTLRPLHERIRDAELERLHFGGQTADLLRRTGKSPSEVAGETGRLWVRGEVEDLVGMPGGGWEIFKGKDRPRRKQNEG